jgi:hypothetical protein
MLGHQDEWLDSINRRDAKESRLIIDSPNVQYDVFTIIVTDTLRPTPLGIRGYIFAEDGRVPVIHDADYMVTHVQGNYYCYSK